MAQLFKLTNAQGLAVKGILYLPAAGAGPAAGAPHDTGVVYLPGIVLGSTAVHRLGIDLARQLAGDRYPVCLFDPTGIGESEGDYPAGTHKELASWIEAGSCVADTLEILDHLVAQTEMRRLVLVGHCGGALTAMYAAAHHPAVAGVLLICPPTIRQGEKEELAGVGVAHSYLQGYAQRLRSPEAWLRFLRGQSSYRTMARVVRGKLRGQLAKLRARLRPQPAPAAAAAPVVERAFNRRLIEAVKMAHADGKRLAFVFGDRDPDVDDFRAFRERHLPPDVGTRILEETSHGFVTATSMGRLFTEIGQFLASC